MAREDAGVDAGDLDVLIRDLLGRHRDLAFAFLGVSALITLGMLGLALGVVVLAIRRFNRRLGQGCVRGRRPAGVRETRGGKRPLHDLGYAGEGTADGDADGQEGHGQECTHGKGPFRPGRRMTAQAVRGGPVLVVSRREEAGTRGG